ncbi:MAG: type II toxin-antitoxin system PemK/MazF family toxin [Planctomycetes bacterium]|nr:type II toxin-antitoxin system PemK/MazF family toxin [Planctomycetota bacterium]
MAKPVAGDVVVLPFPQTNLQAGKRRPALVVADLAGDDLILCQITSQAHRDAYSIELTKDDFQTGQLSILSYIRPNRLFTVEHSVIAYVAARVKSSKLDDTLAKLRQMFS